MSKLSPVAKAQAYQLIIRATWERGQNQRDALDEIHRRGLWLDRRQQEQAGFFSQAGYDADFADWFKRSKGG